MHFVISIPLDPNLAEYIGKKGSENSITYYNRKVDDNVIVGLAPSSVEERFYAVAESMLIADQIVVSTAAPDRLFGEILIGCSLIDRHVIFTKDNDIAQYLKGIEVKNHEFAAKEEVLKKILDWKATAAVHQGSVRVDIDKAFPVKGLGTVALGVVTRGTVKAHDELYHSGSGKKVMVRSLQAQDVDITEAGIGTRVGIVLKGVESDEIDKGDLLTPVKIDPADRITAKITVSSMAKEEFKPGIAYDFIHNFSYAKAVFQEMKDGIATFKLAKAISAETGDTFLLMRDRMPRIFACGAIL